MKTFFNAMTAGVLAIALIASQAEMAPAQQSMQTGDGLIRLQVDMPQRAAVGQQFTYRVQVNNSSDNVVLHDIRLQQTKAKGFTVESVSMEPPEPNQGDQQNSQASQQSGKSKKDKQQSNKNRQSNKKNSGSKKDSGNKQQSQDVSESQQGSKSQEQGSQSSQSSGDSAMTIDRLEPGQSQTLYVTAAADNEGQLRSCLEIVDYTPALCMTAQIVKPELELTKTAPKKADRCDVIELEYAIKNGGSGDVGAIEITDQLGDGLATIEGSNTLRFDVDGLGAGEARRFIARVYASKTGTFSSRAVAKARDSDLQSRSKQAETKVSAADLQVALDGPSRIYGEQVVSFTAQVTNRGNAPANNVKARVMWPENTNLADLSEVSISESDQQGSGSSKYQKDQQQGQPTPAKEQSSQSGQNQAQSGGQQGQQGQQGESGSQDQSMSQRVVTIDQLQPGETAEFEYAVRPGDVEEIPTKVEARYICTVDAAKDEEDARRKTTAAAMQTAKVVRLPAMQMVVIDDEDPVGNGKEVVYTVRVWNEGDARDENVELSVDIPGALEFVSAEGPTEHQLSGSTLNFEPIDQMDAGAEKQYKITAESTGKGNVQLQAKLTSKSLDKPVAAEEPTRLFSRQASR